jgi:glycosyltransferase involved in cell wall biosynthesis
MRVLMMTQVIDPQTDVLGFVPTWIRALAARVEKLYVLAGRVVPCELPANVEVRSLGKEQGKGRLARLGRFYKGLKEAVDKGKVDVIWAHMNPEYVLASAPVTRVPCVLWYSHHTATRRLKLAIRLSKLIVISAREFFPVKTDKLRVIGQGINLSQFEATPPPLGHHLLSVGRLDPVKDFATVIEGAALLKGEFPDLKLTILGEGKMRKSLEDLAAARGVPLSLPGSTPFPELPRFHKACDVFVSASHTALDKAILETMASGRPAIGCAPAFAAWMPPEFSFPEGDAKGLAAACARILRGDRAALGADARARVKRDHSLDSMMDKLVRVFEEARGGAPFSG